VATIVFGGSDRVGRRDRAPRGLIALERYFRALLDRYRPDPADNLLSDLARAEEEGDVLSSGGVVATCVLLLFACYAPQANLLVHVRDALWLGIHHCLGAPLARVEGQVALRALAERLPRLRVVESPCWRPTILGRGVDALPVCVE